MLSCSLSLGIIKWLDNCFKLHNIYFVSHFEHLIEYLQSESLHLDLMIHWSGSINTKTAWIRFTLSKTCFSQIPPPGMPNLNCWVMGRVPDCIQAENLSRLQKGKSASLLSQGQVTRPFIPTLQAKRQNKCHHPVHSLVGRHQSNRLSNGGRFESYMTEREKNGG